MIQEELSPEYTSKDRKQIKFDVIFLCRFFFFLFSLALFLFRTETAKLSSSGLCDLHEVLNLK